MRAETALIIYGSPKGMKGSAANIGDYFADRLQEKGLRVEKVAANRSIADHNERERLLSGFDRADLVLICFPLYVDTLPSGLLAALKVICENGSRMSKRERMLAAECHCGFPESSQTDTAIRSCRHFADRMGMSFAGGIGLCQGGMIGQAPLTGFKYAKKHLPLLDRALDSMVEGEAIPEDLIVGLKRPFVPPRMYVLFANLGWNSMARRHGVRGRITARPFDKERASGH
jgi:hypothetical protein